MKLMLKIFLQILAGFVAFITSTQPMTTPVPSPTPTGIYQSASVGGTTPTPKPKPTVKPVVKTVTKVQAPAPLPTTGPNDIVKCSISATCGGGLREMTKSECDKIICCQTSSGWIVTSKSNCDQTRISECIADSEKYRDTGLTMCRSIYLNGGDGDAWNKCRDSIGQTVNAEIVKCSQ
jgi:hypothetical protein